MALVPIPSTYYIEGISPELGVRQLIDERTLSNLLAFALAFWEEFNRKLVITEGVRSRPRQDLLWDEFQAYLARGRRPPFVPQAARPYTSKHDVVDHGTAIDFGSGIATLGTPAAKWAHANGPRYGVVFTGLTFKPIESWHGEIRTTITPASSGFTPIQQEEDDMYTQEDRDRDNRVAAIVSRTQAPFYLVKRVADGHPQLNGLQCAIGPAFFQALGEGDLAGIARDLRIKAEDIVDGENGGGLPAIEFTRLVSLFHIPPGVVRPGGSYSIR